MGAELSQIERDLIAAAIAAGKVTKIPVGQIAEPYHYVWRGKKLVSVDEHGADITRDEARRRWGGGSKTKRQPAYVADRRAKVVELAAAGRTYHEIATALGIARHAVYTHAKAAGVTVRQTRGVSPRLIAKAAATRTAIVAAYDGKRSSRQIAKLVGVDRTTVNSHLRAAGLEPVGRTFAAWSTS